MNIKLLACLALLCTTASADPMHEFETCMDALGNVESLPDNFPAGEFCAEFAEQVRTPPETEQPPATQGRQRLGEIPAATSTVGESREAGEAAGGCSACSVLNS